LWTICLGWLWTVILLSASWVPGLQAWATSIWLRPHLFKNKQKFRLTGERWMLLHSS
jgi:hypothetical protein